MKQSGHFEVKFTIDGVTGFSGQGPLDRIVEKEAAITKGIRDAIALALDDEQLEIIVWGASLEKIDGAARCLR
jgi:hypothetical protein